MDIFSINKEIKVVGNYDVVVCGGGPAGFIASITAAREGAKVALIERYGFLGGMATAGYVTPISVFSYNGKRNIGGIPWEFVERLEGMDGAFIERPLNNIAFDVEKYKLCAQQMVLNAGVDLYMNSYISGFTKEKGRIVTVIFENKNGSEALKGDMFIDATGDADLAFISGVPMLKYDDSSLQPSSMCFLLSGVDTESKLIKKAMHHNQQNVNCQCEPIREKLLKLSEEKSLPSFGGPWFCTAVNPGSVYVNMTRRAADVTNNRNFTEVECKLREDIYSFVEVLKENFNEFKNCYVSSIATQAGVRESRHIKGIHIITAEEYLNAFKYNDSISRCSHPIDIHLVNSDNQNINFLKKAAFVPYRSMIVDGFPNLVIAGRSISAYKEAFASLRVQASCMGMGQAAGVAVCNAINEKRDVQDISIKKLVSRLIDLGVVLDE